MIRQPLEKPLSWRSWQRSQAITITAKAGVPTIGTSGPDVILGTSRSDIIRGNGGADRICSRDVPTSGSWATPSVLTGGALRRGARQGVVEHIDHHGPRPVRGIYDI
ncbi:MAG: hypothetical protein ACC660_08880, partial [Acidimicrobiales bacterium]